MTGQGAGSSDDATDFLDFAAARQGPALRSATLVTGDVATGHAVALGALRSLAGDWSRVREEGPDRRLRGTLFREAVAQAPEVVARPVEHPVVGPEPEQQREAVTMALAGLGARARAVAALRWLEDRADPETADVLGVDLAVVLDDLEAARRALGAVVGSPPARPPGDDEARELLELVVDEVVEVDLAGPAWVDARERRRRVRRRTAVVGAALVAGGVAAGVVLPDRSGDPGPRPRPTPSSAAGRLPTVAVGGATVVLAPEPAGFVRLEDYPDAPRLDLPRRFGPGPDRPLELLSPAGSRGAVRAVYLLRVGEDEYKPALLLPAQSAEALVVAMAPLHRTSDRDAVDPIDLGPSTIASDRHRMVFPQRGAVVVLEVRSARTRRIPVPDDDLVSAGWAPDGRTVVAASARTGWVVDTRSGRVVRSARQVNAGGTGIGTDDGPVTLRVYSDRGQLMILRRVPGPDLDPYGDQASTDDAWVARGTFFGEIPATGNRYQGLVAAQVERHPAPRILAAPAVPGVPLKAYRPLSWGPGRTVLLEARTDDGRAPVRTVLAWDVPGDRLFRVGTVEPPAPDPDTGQSFTGTWAL